MYNYRITVKGKETIESKGISPTDAFEKKFSNIILEPIDDAFNANICIELLNGKKQSKHYYVGQGKRGRRKNTVSTVEKKVKEVKKSVFSLQSVDFKQVTIKVDAADALTVAQYPYLDSNMAYITVTRGSNHILTVVNKSGSTYSFSWGDRGYELISDNLSRLKAEVIKFLESNNILIDYIGIQPQEVSVYYNDNLNIWQCTLHYATRNIPNVYIRRKNVKNEDEMIKEMRKYIKAEKWEKQKAQTGIDIWCPVNYELFLK